MLSNGTWFSNWTYPYLARSMRVDPKTGSFFMIPRFIRSSTFGLRRKNFRSFSRIFSFSFTIGAVTTAGDSRPAFEKVINFLIFTWKDIDLQLFLHKEVQEITPKSECLSVPQKQWQRQLNRTTLSLPGHITEGPQCLSLSWIGISRQCDFNTFQKLIPHILHPWFH